MGITSREDFPLDALGRVSQDGVGMNANLEQIPTNCMRNTMIWMAGLVLAGVCLSGCATSYLTRLDKVASDEAIAVAKFRVIYNGKDVTKGCGVIFDPFPSSGVPKYGYTLDETGYVFARLPIGANSIHLVGLKGGTHLHTFRPKELTCQLDGGGVINYMGDVTMDWNGMGTGSAIAIGAVSPVLHGLTTGGRIVVSVETNAVRAQEVFRQKFPTDRNLKPSLLVVQAPK